MSEPKIFNAVFPPLRDQVGELFSSLEVTDGRPSPVASSSGYGTDSDSVIGIFGDDVNYLEYSAVRILNHNLKFAPFDYALDYGVYVSGGNVTGRTYTEVTLPNGQRDTYLGFDPVSSKSIEVDFHLTQTPDEEKTVGEIIFLNQSSISLERDFSSYEERWREKVKEIALGDGGIHRVITLSKSGNNLRYEANCQFRFMSAAEIESLRALKESGAPFYFQPESETNPHRMYLVHWAGPFDVRYTSSYKGAGLSINMQLKEVN
jgi:hypothetical protein